jgi:hypothetical protein
LLLPDGWHQQREVAASREVWLLRRTGTCMRKVPHASSACLTPTKQLPSQEGGPTRLCRRKKTRPLEPCASACTCAHARTHARTHTHTRTHTRAHTHAHTHTCLHPHSPIRCNTHASFWILAPCPPPLPLEPCPAAPRALHRGGPCAPLSGWKAGGRAGRLRRHANCGLPRARGYWAAAGHRQHICHDLAYV